MMHVAPRIMDRGGFTPSINPPVYPRRLQRPRKRGVPVPGGAVYVGRPTDFANPFDGRGFRHARSVRLYNRWIDNRLGDLTLEGLGFCPAEIDALHRLHARLMLRLPSLAGRDIQCWCPVSSRWCHGDTLLARANRIISSSEVPY